MCYKNIMLEFFLQQNFFRMILLFVGTKIIVMCYNYCHKDI